MTQTEREPLEAAKAVLSNKRGEDDWLILAVHCRQLEEAIAKAEAAHQPCDMGAMCIDCQPRGKNGECPDKAERVEPIDLKEQARKGCGDCAYQSCEYPDCLRSK